MDFYNDKEQIISSDEYSEDYDDDDALMNDAVKAQSSVSFQNTYPKSSVENKPKLIEKKNKQLSSLIRNKKLFIIYKNKAIKWFSNKKQRERYKVVYGNLPSSVQYINSTKVKVVDSLIKTGFPKDRNQNSENGVRADESLAVKERAEAFGMTKTLQPVNSGRKEDVEHGKRGRSCSPTTNDNSDAHKHAEKKLKIDAPQFYNKINEMFPKFDEILKGHIEFITNDTLKTTEEKMESIFNEIQTLNGIIRSKEAEWNRLIHLKMIKEEIYTRLTRKRHALQFEAEGNAKSQNKLSELKDLELYLSDKQSTVLPTNSSNSSIQQIIEKRANMKPEDLQRESNGTSRLHSLLVSHKVLPSSDTSEFTFCNNGKISLTCKNACLNTSQESYKHHGYRTLLMKGRQEDSTVMKSNMEDSRQKTPDISPREIYSTSLQKKEIQFGKERNFPYCAQHFTVEDLAMTPITAAKKKDINLVFNNLLHRSNNISFKHSNSTVNSKGELELSSPKFTKLSSPKLTQYPFCQHCKIHESRFVCAGCGNQWYCSRTCQISAWDKHSEICTD